MQDCCLARSISHESIVSDCVGGVWEEGGSLSAIFNMNNL